MSVPCALYRHFDNHGVLLYVGISDVPSSRGRTHATTAPWAPYASHGSIVWHSSRAERPVWNRAGADGDTNARVAEYLARRHGRRARAAMPPARRPRPKLVPVGGSASLRAACDEGLVRRSFDAARKARTRSRTAGDGAFPTALEVGPGGTELYLPADLVAWDTCAEGGEAS